ncbi:MAG TPA: hypothetical protein VFV94_00330 [Polyangiaceae bacterium]|nr:hypothetical protein [Polyangiaceae bacterium]
MKRVTVNLPSRLLSDAQGVSKAGITETLVEGLTLIARRRAAEQALRLKGKLQLRIDLDKSRERRR